MVAVQAYIDDSAYDDGDRRLYLAGYINTADKWLLFQDAWEEQLRSARGIAYFKMKEANFLEGEFRGWNTEDRDEKVRQLSRVIRHFRPLSIHCSISRAECDEVLKPVAPHGLASPYVNCFEHLVVGLAHYQAALPNPIPVDFIFDNQEGLGEQARMVYRAVRERQRPEIQRLISVDPIFGDDKEVLPLQAADMLAWHVRRQAETGNETEWFLPDYLSFPEQHHLAADIDRASLERLADGYRSVPGIELVRSRGAWRKTIRRMDESSPPFTPPAIRTHWQDRIRRAFNDFRRLFRG